MRENESDFDPDGCAYCGAALAKKRERLNEAICDECIWALEWHETELAYECEDNEMPGSRFMNVFAWIMVLLFAGTLVAIAGIVLSELIQGNF